MIDRLAGMNIAPSEAEALVRAWIRRGVVRPNRVLLGLAEEEAACWTTVGVLLREARDLLAPGPERDVKAADNLVSAASDIVVLVGDDETLHWVGGARRYVRDILWGIGG